MFAQITVPTLAQVVTYTDGEASMEHMIVGLTWLEDYWSGNFTEADRSKSGHGNPRSGIIEPHERCNFDMDRFVVDGRKHGWVEVNGFSERFQHRSILFFYSRGHIVGLYGMAQNHSPMEMQSGGIELDTNVSAPVDLCVRWSDIRALPIPEDRSRYFGEHGRVWRGRIYVEDDEARNIIADAYRAHAAHPAIQAALVRVAEATWGPEVVQELGFTSPDTEAQKAASQAAANASDEAAALSRGQGYSSSPEHRRAVELHAMAVAINHFVDLDYDVVDKSATKPYDLMASKGEECLFIEVKGTTSSGEQVFLTANEVEWAREHKEQAVLYVVSGISVEEGAEGMAASGGASLLLMPWDVDEGELKALTYRYGVPGRELNLN